MLHTMHDSELIRRYTLDRAGIMFVTNLIRDTLTLTYLATGKMQLCRSDDLGLSQPSISKVIRQTITALSEPYFVAVHFL